MPHLVKPCVYYEVVQIDRDILAIALMEEFL